MVPSPAELLAELVGATVLDHVGAVGVLVRDVPAPDPKSLLRRLKAINDESTPLRVAYLRPGGRDAATELKLDDKFFSDQVEQAERWRNDRNLDALIVVIAHGDEAKLSSLEDLAQVISRDLKRVLVDRALGGPAGQNDVQSRWWRVLADDDAFGLGQLIDYYLALSGKDGVEYLRASAREIHRLGLLPDPTFFDVPHERSIKLKLQANRELIARLQTLTPKDRRTISHVIRSEEDPDVRKELGTALDQLNRTRWEGEGFRGITLQDAERLIKARTTKPGKGDPPQRPLVQKLTQLAAEGLIDPARAEEVAQGVEGLTEQLAALDDTSRRVSKIKTASVDGSPEGTATARLDVLSLMSKLLDEGVYGGLIQIEERELQDILRKFDAQHHLVARWERSRFDELFGHLQNVESGAEVAAAFAAYDEARAACLPLMRPLAVEPLLVAAHESSRALLVRLIDSYEGLLKGITRNYEDLFATFGSDIDEVVGHVLLLETVVIRAEGATYAIAAPTHPLYVWHFARYAQVVEAQRELLDETDRRLVAEAATRLPNFLTSLFVPPSAFGAGTSLPHIGRLGPLPYFGEAVEPNSANDGCDAITSLIDAFLAFEPHSRLGLRIALVEPPDPGVYLTALAELAEAGTLEGAHVTVFRRPGRRKAIELRLDEEAEELVARVFRSTATGRRFTFEVAEISEQQIGPPDLDAFHLVVIFDRSGGRANRARPMTHPIQPLAVPRRIHYSAFNKTVELEPAPGGPFNTYDGVVGRLAKGGQASYLSVHQDMQLRAGLDALAQHFPWTIVADRSVDRDLTIGSFRVATMREGERDVAAFARTGSAFRRPLREVARNYNVLISDAELDDLLTQLSDLLDSGLLNLRPDLAGKTNHNRIKGLLGTLIAARWYRSERAGERLLISLDSDEARRWLHLSGGAQRADLLGFEWTDDHCTVSILEVKAVDAIGVEFAISNGIATGSAVEQALATRRLLSGVFAHDRSGEVITTPARREILREHLYRELAKGSYSPDERRVWSERLQRLLDGEVTVELRCQIIPVRLGVDASTLVDRSAVAYEGQEIVPLRITELNEVLIEALRPREPQVLSAGPETKRAGPPPVTETPGKEEPISDGIQRPAPREEGRAASEAQTAASEEVAATPVTRPRALLGTAPSTYGRQRDIWFDPADPADPLPNSHIMITGETGSGKTQATKAILADLAAFDVPALILDFKDDYSEPSYAEVEAMRVYDPAYQALPFNPMTPATDKRTGLVNPVHHVHQLSDIVRRIYGLGEQQAYRLREALKRAYEGAGIAMTAFRPTPDQVYPTFNEVRLQLEADKAAETVLGRMSPNFDLGLFDTVADTDFASLMESNTVVRLGQLPGDETKNFVAEFFLMALYNFLIRQPQSHRLDRLLVLDEAWRLVESPFLAPLMREGRAFGLGVLIATQFPRDLPEAVSGSTATKLYFSQTQLEQIREVQRTIAGKTSGPEADHIAGIQRGLSPLSCILHSKQYSPFVRVTIKPYFERRAAG